MEPVIEQPKKSTVFHKSTRKAPAIRNAVVARRMAGQPNAKIARELEIGVNTVKSIINLTDVDRIMEDGRLGTMERIPAALKTLDVRLEKNSESAAIWLLDKCFDNQQPSGKRMASDLTLNQTLNVLLHSDKSADNAVEVIVQPTQSPEDVK
jgi:hypothetical protein